MKTYVAQPEKSATRRNKWPTRSLYFLSFFAAHILMSLLWHRRGESFLELITGSLLFALVMTVFYNTAMKYVPTNEIRIDDQGVTATMGKLNARSIPFDEIQSVVEREANMFRGAGLLLSKHGTVGRFWLGGVWVPVGLEDYAQVRAIIASKVGPDVNWPGRPAT